MSFDVRIIKPIKQANILFDCEYDEDLIKIVDEIDSTTATVKNGSKLTYTIDCDGYESITNTFIVDNDYTLTPELKKYVTLTIVPFPSDSTIIITYNGKENKTNILRVVTNTPIKYSVLRENRQTVEDTIILESDKTITVILPKKISSDEDIGKYEKDNSDELNKIKLISEDEYNHLSDDIRKKHIKYNDLLSRYMGVDYTTTLNDCIVQLYWMLPIVHKLTPFTNGTLGKFQADFINYLSQLNALLTSANSLGKKIKKLKKPLKKAGLSSLTDILTTNFALIGGLAGIVYAVMNNPNIFIKTYAQAFEDIDINEIYDRTINETIPNIDYVKGMLNRQWIPEGNLKKNIFDQLEVVDAAADLSLDVLNDLAALKNLVEVANNSEEAMQDLLEMMSTMSLGWALGSLSEEISKLRKDKDKIKRNQNNNNLANAFNAMQESIDKIMNQENYYINVDDVEYLNKLKDERTSTEKILDYQNGYNDALENGYNGESEFQMDAKLAKLKREMEQLGKDSSSYICGYKVGWQAGRNKYENEINHITTKEQKESYNKGYDAGYNYASIIKDLAYSSLEIGELKWFIDMDKHIHYTDNRPYGRIDGKIVYDFNEDGSEHQIGTYDSLTDLIYITSEEKYYMVVDEQYIYDTSIEQEITDDKINEIINLLYKINLMRVERKPAEGLLNPYYAKGWFDGYNDKEEDNKIINDTIEIDENGYNKGYLYGQNAEPISKITEEIEGYKEDNEDTYKYYAQGLVRGYNKYQSEYNSGYYNAYFNSMNRSEYEEGDNPSQDKNEYLLEICEQYGLNKSEQDALPDNEKNSYYLGAIHGWDDAYNEISEPQYRENYDLNY